MPMNRARAIPAAKTLTRTIFRRHRSRRADRRPGVDARGACWRRPDLRRRCVLAKTAAEQMDPRPGRRHHRRSRTTSGCPSSAFADRRRKGRALTRRARNAAFRRRRCWSSIPTAICCTPGAVPGEGYEWVGREHGIEVDDRATSGSPATPTTTTRDPEIHRRRKVRAADRQDRADQGQQRHHATRQARRDHRSIRRQTNLHRRRLWQPARHRVRRHHRRLQAALGRLWQAAERRQAAALRSKAPVSQQFGNPVHCVKVANDGLVYVCDRTNNRIQVFKKDGTFVKEWFYEKNTLGNGAVWDIASGPIRSRPIC